MGKLRTVGRFSLLCHQSCRLRAEVINSEGCAKGLFSRALCFIAMLSLYRITFMLFDK